MKTKKFSTYKEVVDFLDSDDYTNEIIKISVGSEITEKEVQALMSLLIEAEYPCHVQLRENKSTHSQFENLFLRNKRIQNTNELREQGFLPDIIKIKPAAEVNQSSAVNWERVSRAKINLAKGERSDLGGLQFQRERQQKQERQKQKQQQQQQAMQTSLDKRQEQLAKRQAVPMPIIKRNVDESSLGKLIDENNIESECQAEIKASSISDIQHFWKQLVGKHAKEIASKNLDRAVTHVQKQAMDKIMEHHAHFGSGLVLDNLPDGFYLQQTKNKLVLCYDENFNPAPHPRALLKISLPKPRTGPVGDVTQFLWDIPPADHPVFKEKFNDLINQDKSLDERQNALANLINIHNSEWKIKDITDLISSLGLKTDQAIQGLTDIFLAGGPETTLLFLNKMAELKRTGLYKHFQEIFLNSTKDYSQFTEVEFFENIDEMIAFDYTTQEWWEALTQSHKKHIDSINFNELFNAFNFFKTEVAKLANNKALPFFNFKTKNMKVALDRILLIMGRAVDKEEQLEFLSGLGVGAEDAYYASMFEDFKLATEHMKLTHENLEPKKQEKIKVLFLDKGIDDARSFLIDNMVNYAFNSGDVFRDYIHNLKGGVLKGGVHAGVEVGKLEFDEGDRFETDETTLLFTKEELRGFFENLPLFKKINDKDFKNSILDMLRKSWDNIIYQKGVSCVSYFGDDNSCIVFCHPDTSKKKLFEKLEKQPPFGYALPHDQGKFLRQVMAEADYEENKKYFFRYVGQQELALPFNFYRSVVNEIGQALDPAISHDASIEGRALTKEEAEKLISRIAYSDNLDRIIPLSGGNFSNKVTKIMMHSYYPEQKKLLTITHGQLVIADHLFYINTDWLTYSDEIKKFFFQQKYQYREEYIQFLEKLIREGKFSKKEFDQCCLDRLTKYLHIVKKWHASINEFMFASNEKSQLRNTILQILGVCTANKRQLEKGGSTFNAQEFVQLIRDGLRLDSGSLKEKLKFYIDLLGELYDAIIRMQPDNRPSAEDLTNLIKIFQKEKLDKKFLLDLLQQADKIGTVIYDIVDIQQQRANIANIPPFNCQNLIKYINPILESKSLNASFQKEFYLILSYISNFDELSIEAILKLAEKFDSLSPPLKYSFVKAMRAIQISQSDELPNNEKLYQTLEGLKEQNFANDVSLDQSVAEFIQRAWPNTRVVEPKKITGVLMEMIAFLKLYVSRYNIDEIMKRLREALTIALPEMAGNITLSMIEKFLENTSKSIKDLLATLANPKSSLDEILNKFVDLEKSIKNLLDNNFIKTIVEQFYTHSTFKSPEFDEFFETKKFICLVKKPLSEYISEKIKYNLNELRLDSDEFLFSYLSEQLGELNDKNTFDKALKEYGEKADQITHFLNSFIEIFNRDPRLFKRLYQIFKLNSKKLPFQDHVKFLNFCNQISSVPADELMAIIYEIISKPSSKYDKLDTAYREIQQFAPFANELPNDVFKCILKLSFEHNLKSDTVFPLHALIQFKKLNTLDSEIVFKQLIEMISRTPADAGLDLVSAINSTKALLEASSSAFLLLVQTLLTFYQGATQSDWDTYNRCIQKLIGNKDNEKLPNILTILLGVISSKTEKLNSEQLNGLIDKLLKYKSADLNAIKGLFDYRPAPSFKQLDEIHQSMREGTLSEWIKKFDLDPFNLRDEETIKEQFDIKQLQRVVQHIERLPDKTLLSDDEQARLRMQFTYINNAGHGEGLLLNKVRQPLTQWPRYELRSLADRLIKTIRDTKVSDQARERAQLTLLAVAREVYFRTNGKFPHSTQMLAALMSLNHPGNLLLQLNTGEGKSVLSPMLLLMEWAKGATVNFCTANADLASRDQDESGWFYAFFASESQLITQHTQAKEQAERTINYSTMANASLYRANAKLFRNPIKIKGDKPTSLFIDESDADMLDNRTSFNLANGGTENPYAWIYPLINEFIDLPAYQNINPEQGEVWEVRRDIAELKRFLFDKVTLPAQKEQLKRILDIKFKKWLPAATIAKQHREGKEFLIQTDQRRIKPEDKEDKEVFIAVPLDKNIPQEGSTRENGTQQFLQARWQKEKSKEDPSKTYYFPIDDESFKTASETVKNFIERHTRKGGRLLGISATLGSMLELVEQESKYDVQAFSIPPHLPSQRVDLSTQVKPMGNEHIDAVIKQLNELRKTSKKPYVLQPTLIVCKDMEEVKKLYKELNDKLNLPDVKISQVLGSESIAERKKLIQAASEENRITISTSLLGRGTDIQIKRPRPPKKERGLAVIQTYLDIDRVTRQIMGRTARNGALGCYMAILEQDGSILRHGIDLLKFKGKKREEQLKIIYQRMDEEAAVERHYLQEKDSIQNIILDHYHRWYKLILRVHPNPEIERSLLEQRAGIIDDLKEKWDLLLEESDPDKLYSNFYVRRNENGQLETEALDHCVNQLEKQAEVMWNEILGELKTKFLNNVNNVNDDVTEYYQRIDKIDLHTALMNRKLKEAKQVQSEGRFIERSAKTQQLMFESACDKETAYLTYASDLSEDEKRAYQDKSSQHQLALYLKWLPDIVKKTSMKRTQKSALLEQLKQGKTQQNNCATDIISWSNSWIKSYYQACANKVDQFYIQPFIRTVLDLAENTGIKNKELDEIKQHYIENTYSEIQNQLKSALAWRESGKWYHELDRQIAKTATDAILRCFDQKELSEEIKLKNLYKTLLTQKQTLQNKFIFGLFHDNVKKTIHRALTSLDYAASVKPEWAKIREEAELEVLSESKSHLSLSRLTTLKNRQWQRQAEELKMPCAKLHACTIHTGFKEYSQLTIQLKTNEDSKAWEGLGLMELSPTIYVKRFNDPEQLMAFDKNFIEKMDVKRTSSLRKQGSPEH